MLLKSRQQQDNIVNQDMWGEWAEFRELFGNTLAKVNEMHGITGGRALLLGTGNGNDIPINLIEGTFDEIILVDIDPDALIRFMEKVKRPEKIYMEADLSGVGHLIPELKHKSEKHIIELLEALDYEPSWTHKVTGKFDCIINCHYTTQLIAPVFMSCFDYRVTFPSKKYLLALSNCSKRIMT